MFSRENSSVSKANRTIAHGIAFASLDTKFVKINLQRNGSEFTRLCTTTYFKIHFHTVGDGLAPRTTQ